MLLWSDIDKISGGGTRRDGLMERPKREYDGESPNREAGRGLDRPPWSADHNGSPDEQGAEAPDRLFEPVRPLRVSDQVFERIRDHIFRGQLMPGQRVPGERQLAESFGVSRPTIREAMHKLLDRGLIEHQRGVGAFVRQADPSKESPPFLRLFGEPKPDLRDLIEVRLYLECSGVRYAAQRADQDDISLLEANLRRMNLMHEKGDPDIDEDTSFHMNIAFATHNAVHIHLMRNFHDLLLYLMRELMNDWYSLPGYDALSLRQHTEILDAIRRRDPDIAEKVMHEQISTLFKLV